MCGIAGFFSSANALEKTRLDAMLHAIRHRGPDGQGTLLARRFQSGLAEFQGAGSAHAALGHARLAIVDLSAQAAEPMSNEEGTLWLTFNGEIYNHRPLREELISLGHRFRSQCDAEVVLHGYEEEGVSFFNRLEGMYAFGLLDMDRRELVLSRDPFGIKPLCLFSDGGVHAFASELHAIRAGQFSQNLDPTALPSFLALGFVPAPRTLLTHTRKLLPGETVRVSDDGAISLGRRAPPLPPRTRPAGPMTAQHLKAVAEALRQSVRAHLMADVEVGAFLSGGIDSALVTAAMAELVPGGVQAFSVGIEDPDLDESEAAARTAKALGVKHHVLRVGPQEALARLPGIMGDLDEPLADASILPTRLVSELARQHVKVVLSGDGGDELFGGYTRHHLFSLVSPWRPWAPLATRLARRLIKPDVEGAVDLAYWAVQEGLHLPKVKQPARKLRAAAVSLGDDPALQYGRMFQTGFPEEMTSLDVSNLDGDKHLRMMADGYQGAQALALAQAMDLRTYLPDDILPKVDRASMAVGLEARVPLISAQVATVAHGLPEEGLRRGGTGKVVLRKLAEQRLGTALAQAGKKGFGLPLAEWLRGPLKSWRGECLGSLSLRNLVRAQGLEELTQEHDAGINHAPILFTLCALESWLRGQSIRG